MRELIAGTQLDRLAASERQYPTFKVLLHNPRVTTPNQVATNSWVVPPMDVTAFVESVEVSENIGFENGDDPTTPKITMRLRRHPKSGVSIRPGLLADGVIVQIYKGDRRIAAEDWALLFTGTCRGFPADDPGTPADQSEGLSVVAHGREERFLNQKVTTDAFEANTELGDLASHVARQHMGLGMDEVLFGDLGFETKHLTNQLVDINCLEALWQCGFPVGKKPKFDSAGRLRYVDVNLDKPAVAIYSNKDLFRSIKAMPNEIEVNNSVVIRGLSHILTKAKSEVQLRVSFEAITGFFDSQFKERKYYSQDRSQRAEDTYLVTRKKISWSDADWTEVDEFHGVVDIECRTLRNARVIIFVTYLALQIAVTTLDLLMFSGVSGNTVIVTNQGPTTIAIWRTVLYVLSVVALAGLLWAMQFIGRGSYEIWGAPFEYVYQELMARCKLIGLDLSEIRELEYRNDFLSEIDVLEALAFQHLRRETVKNQTYELVMMDNPRLEVDDIIEIEGDRYYITSITRTLARNTQATMTVKAWLVGRDVLAAARAG